MHVAVPLAQWVPGARAKASPRGSSSQSQVLPLADDEPDAVVAASKHKGFSAAEPVQEFFDEIALSLRDDGADVQAFLPLFQRAPRAWGRPI